MTDLRALTVRQPWADLIMAGVKDVENRSWPVPSTLPHHYACDHCGTRVLVDDVRCTACQSDQLRPDGPFPFRLGIHAAVTPTTHSDAWWEWDQHVGQPGTEPDHYGALLGTVEVTGCHHDHEHWDEDAPFPFLMDTDQGWQCSSWAEPDVYHWTLTDPRPLDVPIPMRGMLGLWRLEFVEMAP